MSRRHRWTPWTPNQDDQEGTQDEPRQAGRLADTLSLVVNGAEAYEALEKFAEIVARSLEKGGLR